MAPSTCNGDSAAEPAAIREASCSCGRLVVLCKGEPVRVSMCHCLACQRRTGSVVAVQARWPRERVVLRGESRTFQRTGDSGSRITFYFCPTCGSTVHYELDDQPELVAVAVGAFADPTFPSPTFSVYEARKHAWLGIPADGIEHWD